MSYSCIRGDLSQPMAMTITRDGAAVDLTLADTVQLHWIDPDDTVSLVELTVVDAPTGEVQRIWEAGDTDVVGTHFGQVVVTTGGVVETFPNDGSFIIWDVYPQVGDC